MQKNKPILKKSRLEDLPARLLSSNPTRLLCGQPPRWGLVEPLYQSPSWRLSLSPKPGGRPQIRCRARRSLRIGDVFDLLKDDSPPRVESEESSREESSFSF